MTKKDYELIASAVSKMTSLGEYNHIYVADMLASALRKQNPKFDRNKWFQACGIKPETV